MQRALRQCGTSFTVTTPSSARRQHAVPTVPAVLAQQFFAFFDGNFCCVWHSRNDRHTDSADVIVMIYDVVCFQMTQWRHLGNVGQTNSVVMTTAALILLNDATELMTVQMALMKMSAVGLITMSSNRIFLVTLF